MREICRCVQRDGETISDFAFKLMALSDKLRKIPGAPDPQTAIKEQFRDGLADGVLRRELKRLMRDEPDISFIKLRDWAFDLAEEEGDLLHRRRKVTVNSTEVATDRLTVVVEKLANTIQCQANVMETVKLQQAEIVARLDKLEKEGQKYRSRGRPKDKKDIKCRRCQEMGHYASECPSPTPVNVPAGN